MKKQKGWHCPLPAISSPGKGDSSQHQPKVVLYPTPPFQYSRGTSKWHWLLKALVSLKGSCKGTCLAAAHVASDCLHLQLVS